MVITRETDYALRILRALLDGKLHTAGQIAQDELLPQAFAYKILKKLEKAGLVEVVRGTAGGCRLSADLTGTSLYDLMKAMNRVLRRIQLAKPIETKFTAERSPWKSGNWKSARGWTSCRAHSGLNSFWRTATACRW